MPAAFTKFSPAMWTWLPMPAEPKLIVPGLDLASAISSFTLLAGTDGCTTTSCGPLATLVTAMKSLTGSNGSCLYMCGLTVKMLPDVIRMVCPSGGDLATTSAPMLPPAPARFSTTTD